MGFSLFREKRGSVTATKVCQTLVTSTVPLESQTLHRYGVTPCPLGVLSLTLIFAKMCVCRTISVYFTLHQS